MTVDGEQWQLWNGPSARAWIDAQALLDQAFEPFERLLTGAVAASGARQILDVGCGTGATTLAVARLLGAAGLCTGVDISEPMLAVARARAEREHLAASFVRADAQDHAFPPGSFDLIVSRFGVMFFNDPVRAFANLRRASTREGALRLIVWRSAAENPFMTTAERAAAPLLPAMPSRPVDGPGQFAFARADRVRGILEDGGWLKVDLQPIDVECAFPANELNGYLTRLGPLGGVLQDADAETRARILETVRPAFDRYVHGAHVRFTAACWTVGAQAA